MLRKVAVTGLGAVCAAGIGKRGFWESMLAGQSCVSRITRFDASEHAARIAAEVSDEEFNAHLERSFSSRLPELDRVSRFALLAANLALEDAGWPHESHQAELSGVAVGTSIGGLESGGHRIWEALCAEREGKASPDCRPPGAWWIMMPGSLTEVIGERFRLMGLRSLVTTGCTAAADAIGQGWEAIRSGMADLMVVGGSEAPVEPLAVESFARIGALSCRNEDPDHASRPFDLMRDGFVIGEGAGMIVLEEMQAARSRGAHIYAEMCAYATTLDSFHMTASDPENGGAIRAIRQALEIARMNSADVSYISAHGSSTPLNDERETLVIKSVFGPDAYRIPISSIKSMIGHLSGACGGVQAVSCMAALDTGMIPPTINYEYPDPACDLDYVPNHARECAIKSVLQNTFGFSGKNVAIIYKSNGKE
jgi:3-oxoacyl-[acyl-carrier-protein] synthase II